MFGIWSLVFGILGKDAHCQSRAPAVVHLRPRGDSFRGLALSREFFSANFAVGAAFAEFAGPKAFRVPKCWRHTARFDLRHDRIVDLCLCRAPRCAEKNRALAYRHGATLVARAHLAHAAHDSTRDFAQRLPAESVYEQIPHIRAQLVAAATKMRDSFKPSPPTKPDAGAPAPSPAKVVTAGSAPMASTAADLSTPTARAKSVVGSTITAETIAAPGKRPEEKIPPSRPPDAKPPETMGTPTARVPEGAPVPAGTEKIIGVAPPAVEPKSVAPPTPIAASAATPGEKPPPAAVAQPIAKPPAVAAPAKITAATDADSESALLDFLDRQIIPYLSATRGDRMRLGKARFSEDTFRFVKLRVTGTYRDRVEEIEAWCDERRMLDLQIKLQHWLHSWLFVHAPVSFLLLILVFWHAYVTLFNY